MKHGLAILLRVLVSAVLLALLFRQQAWTGEIWPRGEVIRQNWMWIAAGIACAGLSVALGGWRWWLVLRTYVPAVSPSLVVRATLSSWFFTVSSIGALGGDAFRLIAVGKEHPSSHVKAGASIVVDHVAGLLGLLGLFLVVGTAALVQWPTHEQKLGSILAICGGIQFGAAILMIVALGSVTPGFLRRFGRFTPRRMIPLRDKIAALQLTLSSSWRVLLTAAAVSLPMLVLHFAAFYCALRAVGAQVRLLPVLLAMPLVDMAASLPVSVSGLGVREKVFETLMSQLTHVAPATCIAASLVGWLFTVFWGSIGGIVFILGRRAGPQQPITPAAKARLQYETEPVLPVIES